MDAVFMCLYFWHDVCLYSNGSSKCLLSLVSSISEEKLSGLSDAEQKQWLNLTWA